MIRTLTKIDKLPPERRKQKVAVYCRVSTGRDAQLSSLDNQKAHYERLIAAMGSWELTDYYYEKGVSGTKKETRPELQRMLRDCETGKIDLILTKSISRFARNTTDCLELVRKLNALGVYIYFEKENIHTGNEESELILSILASLAEEESHSISENCKWAVQKRFQNGSFKLSRPPYGYDLRDGVLVVNRKEARIVKQIYNSVLEGKGTCMIAADLNSRRVPTKRGGNWQPGTIQHMIRNEIFMGDLRMQKTWRDEQFRLHINYGEQPQYYIKNHHEAIVSREVFASANAANRQRGIEKNNTPEKDCAPQDDPHQNRYCFTGKILCGCCGSRMKRQVVQTAGGTRAFWVCTKHLSGPSACPQHKIREDDLQNAYVTMLNKLAYSRNILLLPYIDAITAEDERQLEMRLRRIQARLQISRTKRSDLVRRYSQGSLEASAFFEQTAACRREEQELLQEKNTTESFFGHASSAKALDRFLCGWQIGICSFPGSAFRDLTDHILVGSQTEVTFVMKCGLRLNEEIGVAVLKSCKENHPRTQKAG